MAPPWPIWRQNIVHVTSASIVLTECFKPNDGLIDATNSGLSFGASLEAAGHKMASSVPEDYYAVLQVKQSADEKEIRSSYLRLAKLYHPDKNADDCRAKARFQLVSNPTKTEARLTVPSSM